MLGPVLQKAAPVGEGLAAHLAGVPERGVGGGGGGGVPPSTSEPIWASGRRPGGVGTGGGPPVPN